MSFFAKNDAPVATQAQPAQRRTVTPRYDVKETADAFVVTAFVPGVDRSAIETNLDGDSLSVTARRTWTAPEGWTPVYRESSAFDYRLTLELDQRVNRDAIRAELNQGVLTLTLSKAEAVKPRRIEIQG
jgi:HSP20 family molecular chaperone IbpA